MGKRKPLVKNPVLTSFLIVFCVGFIIGLAVLIIESIVQHRRYENCENNKISVSSTILNKYNYTGNDCQNCLELRLRYRSYKAGEVISYLVVECNSLCSNYQVGNNLLIYYDYHTPGKPYLTEQDCDYNARFSYIFYTGLAIAIICLILMIIVIILMIYYNHKEKTKTETKKETIKLKNNANLLSQLGTIEPMLPPNMNQNDHNDGNMFYIEESISEA